MTDLKNGKKGDNRFFNGILSALSGVIVNYHGRILIISAVITLLISAGSIFIKIDTNQENYFPPNIR